MMTLCARRCASAVAAFLFGVKERGWAEEKSAGSHDFYSTQTHLFQAEDHRSSHPPLIIASFIFRFKMKEAIFFVILRENGQFFRVCFMAQKTYISAFY